MFVTSIERAVFTRWQRMRAVEGAVKDAHDKSAEAQTSAAAAAGGEAETTVMPLSNHFKRFLSIVEHELDADDYEPDHPTTTGNDSDDDIQGGPKKLRQIFLAITLVNMDRF